MNKSAKLNVQLFEGIVISLLILIMLLNFMNQGMSEARDAGGSLNISSRCAAIGGYYNASRDIGLNCFSNSSQEGITIAVMAIPLAPLTGANSVIFYVIMGIILISTIHSFLKYGKK